MTMVLTSIIVRKSLHIQAHLILLHSTLSHFKDNVVHNEIVIFMFANTIYILHPMVQGVIFTFRLIIEEIHFKIYLP